MASVDVLPNVPPSFGVVEGYDTIANVPTCDVPITPRQSEWNPEYPDRQSKHNQLPKNAGVLGRTNAKEISRG